MFAYSDEWKKFKPPDDVLEQCHQVLITDNDAEAAGEPFWKIKKWCLAHCHSYIWFDVTDVSDVGYQWDEIASYWFHDEKDAVMFTLKYKGGK
jgi:hypothetical protein